MVNFTLGNQEQTLRPSNRPRAETHSEQMNTLTKMRASQKWKRHFLDNVLGEWEPFTRKGRCEDPGSLRFITACKRKSSPAPRPDDLAVPLGEGMGENAQALQAIARRLSPSPSKPTSYLTAFMGSLAPSAPTISRGLSTVIIRGQRGVTRGSICSQPFLAPFLALAAQH